MPCQERAGRDGDDYLLNGEIGGGWTDNISGDDGTHIIDPFNRPAKRDFVACGNGFDRVLADTKDVVGSDCEKVAVGLAAARKLDQRINESGF